MEEELDFEEDLTMDENSDLNNCPQRSQTMPNIASFIQIQTEEIKIENIENEMDANENEIHPNNIEFHENESEFSENQSEFHENQSEFHENQSEFHENNLELHQSSDELEQIESPKNGIDLHKIENNIENNIDKHQIEKHRKSSSPKILNSVFEDLEPPKEEISPPKDIFSKSRIPKFPKSNSNTMSSAVNAYSKSLIQSLLEFFSGVFMLQKVGL